MLEQLRNHGYTLFTNAIATSDLQYHLLTTSSFTLFAAKDSPLFDLDMASDATAYVTTLRYHVIPDHRHSFADLQNLSSPFLDTLLPHYSVLIGKTQNDSVLFNGVMVDGVRVSDPDLFLGSRIAVHGIDGILVTGLNMYQESDGNGNGSDLSSPPAESPAPLSWLDWNIPAVGALIPTPQLEWNNIPGAASSQKKKRGRRHRKGRGGRRHSGRRRYHHLDDL
ncbi:hypothetical protein BUALT_Bualt11G0005000 [Buddleja alternifolia]|uniref:FAS1 domain-containing protein n=1 Tax=Buddleja alternifolia TaxID=168488 RepID=A0AAV6WQG6_9LAMI|nr:hypothetical protein BUALT_Bualt11G0005000 [Buddleja alternifolia]